MAGPVPRPGCPRRTFLKGVAGTAVGLASCGGPSGGPSATSSPASRDPARSRLPNPFVTADGRPILVSVQGTEFAAMLERGLAALGGLARLVPAGASVLVKPNLNMAEAYPGISRASSIATLVGEVKAVTTGAVTVADRGFDDGVDDYLDLRSVVEPLGGVVGGFDATTPVRREAWPSGKPSFLVYSLALRSPVVVSLCNLKRHSRATYSCAVKNNVGTVAGPGLTETRRYLHEESGDFSGDLLEIASFVHPDLFVVDAQWILTRSGPSVTRGEPVRADRLVLCGDMLATDAYCTRLLETHDPTYQAATALSLLERGARLGLGQPDLTRVEVREISA